MKCPKCGFNSFEFLDNCKKCGVEFGTFKKNFRINPVIFNRRSVQPAAPPQSSEPLEPVMATVVPDARESGNMDFSRGAAENVEPAAQTVDPYAGFELDIPEASPEDTPQDRAFAGFDTPNEPSRISSSTGTDTGAGTIAGDFSFEEPEHVEEELPAWNASGSDPEPAMEGYERFVEPEDIRGGTDNSGISDNDIASLTGDFSFDEPEHVKEESPAWNAPGSDPEPAMEGYERFVEPEDLQGGTEGSGNSDELTGAFGEIDFSFDATPEPESAVAGEDLFSFDSLEGIQEMQDTPEKKPETKLTDFDKEFEEIFAMGSSEDTDKKNGE